MIREFIFPRKLIKRITDQLAVLIRPIIVVGVLLLVVAFALVSYKFEVQYLLVITGLLPAIGGLLFLIRNPALGMLFTLLVGIFVPFIGPSGINAAVLGAGLVIGIWLIKMLVEDRKINFASSRTTTPIFVFFISAILSFVFGQIPWYVFANQAPLDAQLGGLILFLLCGGLFLAIPYVFRELKWLKIFSWVFLAVGGVYVMGRAVGLDFLDQIYQNGFISNSMFWTWLVAIAFGQLLINNELRGFRRIMLVVLLIVTAYVAYVINGDWKSGYIPALVAVGTILAIRFPRLTVALSPVAIVGFIFVVNQAIASDQYSYGTRLDAWIVVLEISKISPILGMGFANYSFYARLFPIRGYFIKFNSHSQYVDIVAQTGLVGLTIFLWIIVEVSLLAWKLKTQVKDGFSKGYIYGVLGGIAGTMVAAFLVDWVLPYVYNIGFNGFRASLLPWVFFGGLVSIEQMVKNSE